MMEEKPAVRSRLPVLLLFAAPAVLVVAAVIGLVTALPAAAARYTVSECGWYNGHDAGWTETSSARFTRSTYCQPPRSSDAFDGVHLTSQTKSGAGSVAGTKFARWRWSAPDGTTITNAHGHRWQVVNDGFQHRLGGVTASGFTPFLKLGTTDTSRREFRQNLAAGTVAFESRLLCARVEGKRCSAAKTSLAGVRALTFTLEDPHTPTVTVSGALAGGGWLRGSQTLGWNARDRGSGLRFAETTVDGAVRARTEHSCSRVSVGGQMRGGRMRPCELAVSGNHTVNTAALSDGPHQLKHCAIDFAQSSGCAAPVTVRTDNTAPASPRELTVAGGDGWHRTNDFRLDWTVPDQGAGAPVTGSRLRLTGPDGFASGVLTGTGPDRAETVRVPAPGAYRARIWLLDAAGNEREDSAAAVPLRFDDVPPTGYFHEPAAARPEQLTVSVADRHSGVTAGTISMRPRKGGEWRPLPTVLSGQPDDRRLTARIPSAELDPGVWQLQAVIRDAAGNETVTGGRANGAPMTISTPLRIGTALTARLVAKSGSGPLVRTAYGSRARLVGRLAAGAAGQPGAALRVTELPAAGSLQKPHVHQVRTGADGSFRVWLRRGPSRQVTVAFAGNERQTGASAGPFSLRVRGALGFRAGPRRLSTGRKLRFRGRVKSALARRPATGSLVAIQYLERASRRWRPVLITRTGRHGRYRAAYRFRYITGSAVVRLRAVLLASPWFPYAQGSSRVVRVRVRG